MRRGNILGCLAAVAVFTAMAARAEDARAVHDRLLTLDTHLDTPANFRRPGWDMMERHQVYDNFSFVDFPRMEEGGLDGGFFAIFVGQGDRNAEGFATARDTALMRALQIREMVARNEDHFVLAFRAEDAARIAGQGKRVVFQSMENAYPLGTDLSLVKTFYDLGVRMIGPVHFRNNEFGDSSTDPDGAEWNGLSPLGRALVTEANRLGIVLDASHASDAVLEQMIHLSATPVILSHSGARAVWDHPRNVPDALILALAASGGVIQINAYSDYMVEVHENPEREAALDAVQERFGGMRDLDPEELVPYTEARRAVEAAYPEPRADFDDVMDHLLHALRLVGPDHVGLGLDWDGGGGVTGMEDVSAIPRITERLLAEGYSETDLAKIWGGNALRVLEAAETHAAAIDEDAP